MAHYLYKITNTINNKLYIGHTSDPKRRKAQHFFKKVTSTKSIIRQAIDKYGVENFTFNIICIGSKEYIIDLEVKAISLYRTTEKKFGYNIKPGGEVGAGYKISKTKRDLFHFVSGFWFPNVRTALTSLNLDKKSFLRKRGDGTLGNFVDFNSKSSWSIGKVYVGGFWFDNIRHAAAQLNVSPEAVNNRIRKGSVEQAFSVKDQTGDKNHMFGISPKDHHSSKQIIINGVLFDCYKDATAATGISKYLINKGLKDGDERFQRHN